MGEIWERRSNTGAEQRQVSGLTWKSSAPPDPASLREECLSAAEEAAQQVLNCVHPTLDSEEKRRDITDYVQRLIKNRLNSEVVTYGSVPLKTYLPDGDIDLTVINGTNADESLAHDVFALLQMEENSADAEFKVKDTQYIDAEVKLVKCLVRDLIIDISFNQLGGLSTLCFLEQVDRLVGRDHLFKRSIILIKAWCYYESRILGAHHGLISTYALETLILYIFHLYNSSLCGPLMVLYKFLEYYSKFDWENYCISLKGPVCKSSLPDIVVKVPENGWNGLMFRQEFLENCMEMFTVPSRELEEIPKAFQTKHLNIIDPLKENNNLGRSVHIGNFYRIRSAFKYGARKLGQVLSLPFDKVADEIHKFFSNAIARHGNDSRNFVQHLALEFGEEETSSASPSLPVKVISEENMLLRPLNPPLKTASEGRYPAGDNLGQHIAVKTYDVIISNRYQRNDSPYHAPRNSYSTSLSCNNSHGPLCFVSKFSAENGSLETGNFLLMDSASPSRKYGFESCMDDNSDRGEVNYIYQWCKDSSRVDCTTDLGPLVTKAKSNNVDDMSLCYKDVDLASTGESEACDPLADLTGDYECHIRSLLYGQLCHGYSLAAVVHHRPSRPSWTKNKKPWHIVRRAMPCWWSQFSQTTVHPVQTEQSNYRAADVAPPAPAPAPAYGFRSEAQTRRVNGSVGEWRPLERSSKTVSGYRDQLHRHGQSNRVHVASGVKSRKNNIREDKDRYQHQRRLGAQSILPRSVGNGNQTNDDSCGSWKIEFGSVGNLGEEAISCSAADTEGSTLAKERCAGEPIHLKNEAEFPRLC